MSKRRFDLIDRKYQASLLSQKFYELSKLRGRILSRRYLNYSNKIASCAESALYVQKIIRTPHYDGYGDLEYVEDQERLRLVKSSFCRIRLCPICQWRRAVRSQAVALKVFPEMLQQLPAARYLFLTLTIKNCSITQLADQARKLNYAWNKLTNFVGFPALGWVKSLEITLPSSGEAHPHLHCLLMVVEDYFETENFWSHDRWIASWRKAAQLDYDPSIRIRAIYPGQEMTIVPEMFKYSVKPIDLNSISLVDLHHLCQQTRNLKTISKSGSFKTFFSAISDDYSDLLGNNHNTDTVDVTGYRMSLQFLPDSKAYQVDHWENELLVNREILDLQAYHQETLAK